MFEILFAESKLFDKFIKIRELENLKKEIYVVAKFKNVINFKFEKTDDSIFALASKYIAKGPNLIILNLENFEGVKFEKFNPLRKIYIDELFDLINFNCSKLKFYNSLKNTFSISIQKSDIEILEKIYKQKSNKGSFNFSIIEYSNSEFDLNIRISEQLIKSRENFLKSLDFSDEEIISNALNLIGLGHGLTPSGDDYICGFFSVMLIDEKLSRKYLDLYKKIVDLSKKRTNEISYSYMIELTNMSYKQVVFELIKAMSNSNHIEITKLSMELLKIGHYSGADMLRGIIDALNVINLIQIQN